MSFKKVPANQILYRTPHDDTSRRVSEFNCAVLIKAVNAFTDGIEDAGLVALKFSIARLQLTFKPDNAGVRLNPGNDFLRLKRLGNINGAAEREAFYFFLQAIQSFE